MKRLKPFAAILLLVSSAAALAQVPPEIAEKTRGDAEFDSDDMPETAAALRTACAKCPRYVHLADHEDNLKLGRAAEALGGLERALLLGRIGSAAREPLDLLGGEAEQVLERYFLLQRVAELVQELAVRFLLVHLASYALRAIGIPPT